MKKLLSIILLSLPTLLLGQEFYMLKHIRVIQYDTIVTDDVIDGFISKRETNLDVFGDISYNFDITSFPDSLGYTNLNKPADEESESQNWQYKISPLTENTDDSLYTIVLLSDMPGATNNLYYIFLAKKKILPPHQPRNIENLDLSVVDYSYFDSLGNRYSERVHSNFGVIGNYSSLKIRSNEDITTFTFTLRTDIESKKQSHKKEVYKYRMTQNMIDVYGENWQLIREDGIVLSFDFDKRLQLYSLTIPIDKHTENRMVYVFSK